MNNSTNQVIKDSVYQAISILNIHFYQTIFTDAFNSEPVYTVQFMLSLLTVTPRQKKLYGIDDVKKCKVDFLKSLVYYLNKNMKYEEEDVQNELTKFRTKVEKRLAKLEVRRLAIVTNPEEAENTSIPTTVPTVPDKRPEPTAIKKIEYVASNAEYVLDWLEQRLYNSFGEFQCDIFNHIKNIRPLCKFFRLILNDNKKMKDFLNLSGKEIFIFIAYDVYQKLGESISIDTEITLLENLFNNLLEKRESTPFSEEESEEAKKQNRLIKYALKEFNRYNNIEE